MQDNRSQNKYFDHTSLTNYLLEYAVTLRTALSQVSPAAMEEAAKAIFQAKWLNKRIFVCGNGGSAAIAEHLTCDFGKGCHLSDFGGLKVHSLSSNISLISAIANDIGYEDIFSKQLEFLDAHIGDVLILISSSGNSPNIVSALEYAKKNKITSIGLTGFSGGELRRLCDIEIHVPFSNYGIVEDSHQAIMHVLAQHHYLSLLEKPSEDVSTT